MFRATSITGQAPAVGILKDLSHLGLDLKIFQEQGYDGWSQQYERCLQKCAGVRMLHA